MSEVLQPAREGICTMELVIRKRKYFIGLCTNLLHYRGNYIYHLTNRSSTDYVLVPFDYHNKKLLFTSSALKCLFF